jgi:hypothetical protein
MPHINIQVQRIAATGASAKVETLLHIIHSMPSGNQTASLQWDAPNYCNIFVDTSNAADLWANLSRAMESDEPFWSWLKQRWIVILEGKNGWNDYLLLAHFKRSSKLDTLDRN